MSAKLKIQQASQKTTEKPDQQNDVPQNVPQQSQPAAQKEQVNETSKEQQDENIKRVKKQINQLIQSSGLTKQRIKILLIKEKPQRSQVKQSQDSSDAEKKQEKEAKSQEQKPQSVQEVKESPSKKLSPVQILKNSFAKKQASKTQEKSTTEKRMDRFGKQKKCKFYPNCKFAHSGSKCPFRHATPCRNYPQCPYNTNCNYVHVVCPCDLTCINKSCPYVHSKQYNERLKKYNANEKSKLQQYQQNLYNFIIKTKKQVKKDQSTVAKNVPEKK